MERARGFQAVHTVAALAGNGMPVEFAFPLSGTQGRAEPFRHYGVVKPASVDVVSISRTLPWPLTRVHSNRFFFHSLRKYFGGRLEQAPLMVRHLKLAALLARRAPRVRFLYEAHEVFGDTAQPSKRDANRALERIVMENAAAVASNSAATAARLVELYGGRAPVVVPNGVDRPATIPEKPWREAGRHIVYAGSFFPWKGVGELVAAAEQLPGCRIELIGGDATRISEMKAALVPGGAEVEFPGRIPHGQVMARLAAACVAVLPNRADADSAFTSPIKLFEYMAAGCAIVATDLPALREILGDGDAVWVKANDPTSLAKGIRELVDNPKRAQFLGERARALSAAYTWSARGRKLVALIEGMMGNGAAA